MNGSNLVAKSVSDLLLEFAERDQILGDDGFYSEVGTLQLVFQSFDADNMLRGSSALKAKGNKQFLGLMDVIITGVQRDGDYKASTVEAIRVKLLEIAGIFDVERGRTSPAEIQLKLQLGALWLQRQSEAAAIAETPWG